MENIKKTIKISMSFMVAILGLISAILAIALRIFSSVAFEKKPFIKLAVNNDSISDHLDDEAQKGQQWLRDHDDHIVCMTNREGLKLYGHYIPAENARCTVIEFHGWHGSWDIEFSASSPYIHKLGCNLLLVDQRGQGRSEGDIMTFGLKERFDLMDWIHWYQETMDAHIPIYLGGVSMGATTVLMAASDDFPQEVKGIFADCGFTSPYEILKTVGKQRFSMPEHPMMDLLNLYCRIHYKMDLKSWSTMDGVKNAKLPILFVHGKEDKFVPWEMTEKAYQLCTSAKDLFLVEGATHGMSFLVEKEEYLHRIESFVENTIHN